MSNSKTWASTYCVFSFAAYTLIDKKLKKDVKFFYVEKSNNSFQANNSLQVNKFTNCVISDQIELGT